MNGAGIVQTLAFHRQLHGKLSPRYSFQLRCHGNKAARVHGGHVLDQEATLQVDGDVSCHQHSKILVRVVLDETSVSIESLHHSAQPLLRVLIRLPVVQENDQIRWLERQIQVGVDVDLVELRQSHVLHLHFKSQ